MDETHTDVSLSWTTVPMAVNVTEAPYYWENDMSRLLYAIPCTIFMVIGTIGNILSFLIYSRKSMRQSVTSVYFRFLAISDTVVLFSGGVVFFGIGVLGTDIRTVSEASCKFWIPLLTMSCYHSCWILVFIALDRFVGVHMPHKYRQYCTKRRALIVMAVWFLIVFVLVGAYRATVMTIQNGTCTVGTPYANFFNNVYCWFDLTVLNLIPSAVLVTVNVSIIVKLCRSASNDAKSTKSTKITSPTLILISVSIVYLLCTIPTSTVFIVLAAFRGPRQQVQTILYIRSCETLYLFNHGVNFFLYCLHGTTFRKELAALFGCKLKKYLTSSSSSHGPSTDLSVYRKKSDVDQPRF